MSFEDAPPFLRDREAEEEGRACAASADASAPPIRSLPVLGTERSRPVRVLLVGSGRQARRLARAAAEVTGLSIDAVASPHAPDADVRDFGGCPRFRSIDEAIDAMRPEAVIVAASTDAHHTLARVALDRGIPALVEKPLARTGDEAEDLVRSAVDAVLVPAHNLVFSGGIDALFDAGDLPCLTFTRRVTPHGPEAMRAWSRAALSEVLHHALSVTQRAAGGGLARVTGAFHHGANAPERIRIELAYPHAAAELALDFTATSDETSLVRRATWDSEARMTWRRTGRATALRIGDRDVPVERDGSDLARMLAHFRDVVLGRATPRVTAADGLEVMRATRAAIEALEAAGAPFERAEAPRHVASPALAAFPRGAKVRRPTR